MVSGLSGGTVTFIYRVKLNLDSLLHIAKLFLYYENISIGNIPSIIKCVKIIAQANSFFKNFFLYLTLSEVLT